MKLLGDIYLFIYLFTYIDQNNNDHNNIKDDKDQHKQMRRREREKNKELRIYNIYMRNNNQLNYMSVFSNQLRNRTKENK